ncbi:MAG: aminomethyl-transferring glycine dehydrogenase subunit GcvPB [Clostridiales bacterium]|jgi:glycine dehydrogenase subunit 2|nr:aminomethyl-transferring glycine dehydrogenase subunit GcvPB [Clostridiales bacterium]
MRKPYKLIFEKHCIDRRAADLPALDVPKMDGLVPQACLGEALPLPSLSEMDLVRHYTGLSRRNFGVDNGSYPLGSCTMKYNPKLNEELTAHFNDLHPLLDDDALSAAYELQFALDRALCAVCGMDKFTLQPAAGAHGELTGLMVMRSYHNMRQDFLRAEMLIPDAAHGTNPASATMAGFKAVELKSLPDGGVDVEALKQAVSEKTAGLMLTNPNTLGLFEKNILEITQIVHDAGGLVYYDGANINAIMGKARPGDMGFDVMHVNLHKSFGTPHGGGGPGAGPVGVKKELIPFLPAPLIMKKNGRARPDYDRPLSIGRVKAFNGNFGVLVKAYAYILSLGADGLREASEAAVLNANYLRHYLKDVYELPYDGLCMHEFVLTPGALNEQGIHNVDIAKALIDYGYHPPTISFPLIVREAMMFEPTETESREDLDGLIYALRQIAETAKTDPDSLRSAPLTTPVGRPDETRAARNPIVIAPLSSSDRL